LWRGRGMGMRASFCMREGCMIGSFLVVKLRGIGREKLVVGNFLRWW
jgi:hypothetical protein